jgi:hypothetical protein
LQSKEKATYLIIHDAVEDVDEETLQGVEEGKDVCHEGCPITHVQQAEGPGQAKQNDQHNGSLDPRSERSGPRSAKILKKVR